MTTSTERTNGSGHPGTGLIPVSRQAFSVSEVETMARHAAASRLFGMDAAQAFVLMCIAQAQGLHPIEALQRYHVIQGRPAMRAEAMLAGFQERGGRVEWQLTTEAECEAVFRHPVHAPRGQRVRFDLDDAKRAGLAGKDNWKHYPASMLRARVISMGVRMILPEVLLGLYTPEEVQDFIPDRAPPPSASPGPSGRGGGASPPKRPWRREQPAPAPAPAPASGGPEDVDPEWKDFIRRESKAAHDDLDNALKLAGKSPSKDPVCTGFQVVNWLCSTWIEEQTMEAADISGPNGKRDRNLANEAVAAAYARSPEEVRVDIRAYVAHKLADALRDAGLEVPNDPDGDDDAAQATADEDPAAEVAP